MFLISFILQTQKAVHEERLFGINISTIIFIKYSVFIYAKGAPAIISAFANSSNLVKLVLNF